MCLKTWTCLGQKFYYPVHDKGWNAHPPALKPVIDNCCHEQIHVIVIAFVYLEYIQHSSSKSIVQAIPCLGQGISFHFPVGGTYFTCSIRSLSLTYSPVLTEVAWVSIIVLFCCYVAPFFLKPSEVKPKIIEVKIIKGSKVWPGLWKTLSFKTRLEKSKIPICHRRKINTR